MEKNRELLRNAHEQRIREEDAKKQDRETKRIENRRNSRPKLSYMPVKSAPLYESKYYKNLKQEADRLDKKYFNGLLKENGVKYSWDPDMSGASGRHSTKPILDAKKGITHSFGEKSGTGQFIRLSEKNLLGSGDKEIKSILLHEMVHADDHIKKEDDYSIDKGHGPVFQNKIKAINEKRKTKDFPLDILHHQTDEEKIKNVKLNAAQRSRIVKDKYTKSKSARWGMSEMMVGDPRNSGFISHDQYEKMMSPNYTIPPIDLKIHSSDERKQMKPFIGVKEKVKDFIEDGDKEGLKNYAIKKWGKDYSKNIDNQERVKKEIKHSVLDLMRSDLYSRDYEMDEYFKKYGHDTSKWKSIFNEEQRKIHMNHGLGFKENKDDIKLVNGHAARFNLQNPYVKKGTIIHTTEDGKTYQVNHEQSKKIVAAEDKMNDILSRRNFVSDSFSDHQYELNNLLNSKTIREISEKVPRYNGPVEFGISKRTLSGIKVDPKKTYSLQHLNNEDKVKKRTERTVDREYIMKKLGKEEKKLGKRKRDENEEKRKKQKTY